MVAFETEAQRRIYTQVESYLLDLFDEERAEPSDTFPSFWVPHGSTAAIVSVLPWGDDDATISIRAYVLFSARLDEELMYHLLHENDGTVFGSFGLDEDDDVFFEHTILGSTCDRDEVRASVNAVMTTADDYDDALQERWGGERTLDRLRKKFK
jgi:hypothetical protein